MAQPTFLRDKSQYGNDGHFFSSNIDTDIFLFENSINNDTVIRDSSVNLNNGIFDDSRLAPALYHAGLVDGNYFYLEWTPLDNILHYIIEIATDINFTSILSYYNAKNLNNAKIGVNQYNIIGQTTLYARVRAFDSNLITSYNSNIIEISKPIGTNSMAKADYIKATPFTGDNFITDSTINNYEAISTNVDFPNSTWEFKATSGNPNKITIPYQVLEGLNSWTLCMKVRWNGNNLAGNHGILQHTGSSNVMDFGAFYHSLSGTYKFYFNGAMIETGGSSGVLDFSDGLIHTLIIVYTDANGYDLYYDDMIYIHSFNLIHHNLLGRNWTTNNLVMGTKVNLSNIPITSTSMEANVDNVVFYPNYASQLTRRAFKLLETSL